MGLVGGLEARHCSREADAARTSRSQNVSACRNRQGFRDIDAGEFSRQVLYKQGGGCAALQATGEQVSPRRRSSKSEGKRASHRIMKGLVRLRP